MFQSPSARFTAATPAGGIFVCMSNEALVRLAESLGDYPDFVKDAWDHALESSIGLELLRRKS